ncbi:hypothetical protein ACSS6W_009889 [Trichoderma asperelloides]
MTTPQTPPPNPNDNDSHLVYIPAIIFLVISPVVVALRVWARLRQGGKMGADDWTAMAALCNPVVKAFDKAQKGTCINLATFWFANAGFSIATDVIILLLPMPLVYQLEVPRPQKIALIAVFAIGVFVVITSCLRVTTLDVFATSSDNTYDIANVMWTIIEPNVAILCACLPTLRQLVVKLFPALGSKNSANRYGTPGYDSNGYGSKSRGSRGTGGRSQIPLADEWVEPGAKSNGIHMATIRRNNSSAGSEDSILAGGQNDANNGIKRTVEYSIQYSEKN